MSEDKEFEFRLEELRKLREKISELEIAYPVIDHRDGFISRIMENLQDILTEAEGLFEFLKDQIDMLRTDLDHVEENLLSLAKEFEKVRS